MKLRLRHLTLLTLMVTSLLSGGCATTLVQAYDDKLFTDTEALFKKAATMIDDGLAKSPRTDADRAAILAQGQAAAHPAHALKFEARYNELATDSDALILRALVKSQEVGALGEKLQRKIGTLIEESIPSACPEADAEFKSMTSSLTVANYLDLKCLFVTWKARHSDSKLTESTGILKRVNWELRKSTLFAAVLAIQKAEAAKKK